MRPPISQLDLDACPSLEAGSPMSWEPFQTPANQESVSLHSPVKPGLWGQRSVGRRVQKGQLASSLVPALRGRTTEDHSSRKRLSCHPLTQTHPAGRSRGPLVRRAEEPTGSSGVRVRAGPEHDDGAQPRGSVSRCRGRP